MDKIKNIYILIRCFLKYLIFGKANKKIENPKKILIIQLAKLGDMICTTPMFRAIKNKYPECKLYVMGNSINKQVLAGNLDVDEYIIADKFFSKNLKRIKKENFDFACITSPSFLNLALLYLAGIPLIASPVIKNGFCPFETKSYKLIKNLAINKPHHMRSYAPREYLRLLEPIDIKTDDTKKYISYSKEAKEKIEDFFQKNNINNEDLIVGISPSAGNKIKMWSRKRFAQIADYLFEKYNAKVIIIGGKNDKQEVEEMIGYTKNKPKIINTLELFNIDELKALVAKMNLFTSVDTGPIYIAEAFEVPTVDITGPIDENEQPPISEKNLIVKPMDREKPELYVMNAKAYNKKEARRQTDQITVEMVKEKLDELIKIINHERKI